MACTVPRRRGPINARIAAQAANARSFAGTGVTATPLDLFDRLTPEANLETETGRLADRLVRESVKGESPVSCQS
jgi:hypothetical protein